MKQRSDDILSEEVRLSRLRSLFAGSSEFVSIIDTQGRIRFETDAVGPILGHPTGALLGQRSFDFIHPEDLDATVIKIARLLAEPGAGDRARFRFRRADGLYLWIDVTARNLIEDSLVKGVLMRSRDVTAEVDEETRYGRLFDANPVPTVVYDPATGAVLGANDAAVQQYGHSREEFLELKTADLGSFAALDAVDSPIAAPTEPVRHRRRSGEVFEVEGVTSPIRFEGNAARIACIRDISERRRAEREIMQRDRYLLARVDIQRELIAAPAVSSALPKVMELLGHAADASRVLYFDYPPARPDDNRWGSLWNQWCAPGVAPTRPPEDRTGVGELNERFTREWLPLLAGGATITATPGELSRAEAELLKRLEVRLIVFAPVRAEGELCGMICFHDCGTREEWSEPERSHLQSVASLIGLALAHEHSSRALASDNEQLDVLLASLAEGVIATDSTGRITLVNAHAERLLGCEGAALLGRQLTEFFVVEAPSNSNGAAAHAPDFDAVAHVLATGETLEGTRHGKLVRTDGRRIPIAGQTSPVRDATGSITGVVRVFRDASSDERAAAELLKASKLESVGLLAGGIAHDFNNILTAITGNLSLLAERTQSDPISARTLVETMEATWRARDLTTQLLTFSKGGAPIKKVTRVQHLVGDAVVFALRGSRVSSTLHLPEDLPLVEVDPGQIGQIIHNIALNAVQAMPEGGHLTVSAEAMRDGDGGKLAIVLRDDGPGITPENISKIFDPFFTTKTQGTGLGLSASFSIARAHGGTIVCESQPGHGATFRVELPVCVGTDPGPPLPPPPATPLEGHRGGRVLLMDDEEPIRLVGTRMLVRLGYEVTSVSEGESAVAAFRQARDEGKPFVTAILDLTVPGAMGGEAAMREIARLDPQFGAIVSSGYSSEPALANPRRSGFVAALKKPYRLEELAEVLLQTLCTASCEPPQGP